MNQLFQPGETNSRRVVILRALRGLGDLLVMIPAARALRAALPEAEITLLGLPWAHTFIARFNTYFDRLCEFPGYPGIPEWPFSPVDFPAQLASIQAQQFDLALQMHGSGVVVNSFMTMLGAQRSAGFYQPGFYNPDPDCFLAYPDHLPEVRRHLKLMEFLGVPLQGEYLEFPLFEEDWQALAAIPEAQGLSYEPYVCIHPGAHETARRWPPERFAAVGNELAAAGYRVVLTGTTDEAALAQSVARKMKAPVLNLAGRTSLGAMAALLSRAALLVSNDTGVSHLAAALRTPSVVIFIASNPGRWAPLDRQLHRPVGRPAVGPVCGADGAEVMASAVAAPMSIAGQPVRRCLGENCFTCHNAASLQPVEATVEMVLAQARDLLLETVHVA